MKIKSISSALLAIVLMLGLSQATLADRPSDKPPSDKPPGGFTICNLFHSDQLCHAELIEVQGAIIEAESIKGRTFESLQFKVCVADDKVHVEKWSDAAQKLRDIALTVTTKKKVESDDADLVADKAEEIAIVIETLNCDPDL